MPPKTAEKRSLKVDLHIHSHFSPDGGMSPEEVLKTAEMAGLDVIAVTDHNTIKGGLETRKLVRERDIIVIVGEEIKTEDGEVIGLGLKENIEKGLPLEETCRLIKGQKGLVMIPHPFEKLRKGVGKKMKNIIDYIDAVEVFNARCYFERSNRKAEEFAREHNLPVCAGSDAHFSMEIGSAYMVIDSEKNADSVLRALKECKAAIVGKRTGIRPHLKTTGKNIKRKLRPG